MNRDLKLKNGYNYDNLILFVLVWFRFYNNWFIENKDQFLL